MVGLVFVGLLNRCHGRDVGGENVLNRLDWAVWRRRRGNSRSLSEAWALKDHLVQLSNAASATSIGLEAFAENRVKLVRKRQNSLEKVPVLHVSPEGGILTRGTLPWVAAASQVDQNDTKRPDIVGGREVVRHGLRVALLALRRHVESGSAAKIRSIVVFGGKAKVGKLNGHAAILDQDILRLQIAVVNTN